MTHSTVVDRHQSSLFETASAEFSDDRTYRYALTRTWDPELPPVAFVMLNPSTADAFRLDPTVTRCVDFARRWGAGGLLVLNLFALRSTDPAALRRHPEPIGPRNNDVITRMAAGPLMTVVAAWGVHGVLRGRAAAVSALLRQRGIQLHCFGTTEGGQPRHPLYVRRATPLTPHD